MKYNKIFRMKNNKDIKSLKNLKDIVIRIKMDVIKYF